MIKLWRKQKYIRLIKRIIQWFFLLEINNDKDQTDSIPVLISAVLKVKDMSKYDKIIYTIILRKNCQEDRYLEDYYIIQCLYSLFFLQLLVLRAV